MYKIYIKETPLLLVDSSTGFSLLPGTETSPVALYTGKTRQILNFFDLMEKNNQLTQVTLFHPDPELIFNDMRSLLICLEAAGGIVEAPSGEIVAIYRRKMWDLPKGKIENGESMESCALREVEEEVGISGVQLQQFLLHTYHIYKEKGRRTLKKTAWYKMTAPQQMLHPQLEEDIEKAIWIEPRFFDPEKYPTYQTIREVLRAGLPDRFRW